MKRLLSALALAVMTMAASAANASPVTTAGNLTLTGFEQAGAPGGTVFGYGSPVSAGIGGLNASFDDGFGPSPFIVFCVDLFSHAGSFGSSITYDKIDYAQSDFALALEPANINALSKLFTYNGGVSSLDATKSAGMQLAVWELLYDGEGGSLSTGDFKAGSAPLAAKTWATSLLAGASTSNANYAITLFADEAYRSKPNYQNFITATLNSGSGCELTGDCVTTNVPEPSTGALALAGLGAIGFLSRRRKLV
jgi:MYXO-CTERM domain-containing protein